MDLLSINGGMVYWTVFVFSLLLFVLGKFAWKPMLAAIDEREAKISGDLEQAEKAKNEADKSLAALNKRLDDARTEADEIISTSRNAAENLAETLKQDAKDEASKILENAQKAIQAEKNSALNELRKEVTELAVGAANKIILANLDAKGQEKLVDSYINEMPKNLN
jgi:F-type H+-transporting ATPase subunit b